MHIRAMPTECPPAAAVWVLLLVVWAVTNRDIMVSRVKALANDRLCMFLTIRADPRANVWQLFKRVLGPFNRVLGFHGLLSVDGALDYDGLLSRNSTLVGVVCFLLRRAWNRWITSHL